MGNTKTKIDILNQVELIVQDVAKDLWNSCIVNSVTYDGVSKQSTFVVNSTGLNIDKGFHANDQIYLVGGSSNAFASIYSVTDNTHIVLAGDYHTFPAGTVINKTGVIPFIDEALLILSKYHPKPMVLLTSITTPEAIFSMPSDFDPVFPFIKYIEYPTGNDPRDFLASDEFEIYLDDDSSTYKLRFYTPLTKEFRMSYYKPHYFDSSDTHANNPLCSISDSDFFCLCNLIGGKYMITLAGKYGQTTDKSSISADTVNYLNKVDAYRRLGNELYGSVAQWLGIEVGKLLGSKLEPMPYSSDQEIVPKNLDKRPTLFHDRNRLYVVYNYTY